MAVALASGGAVVDVVPGVVVAGVVFADGAVGVDRAVQGGRRWDEVAGVGEHASVAVVVAGHELLVLFGELQFGGVEEFAELGDGLVGPGRVSAAAGDGDL